MKRGGGGAWQMYSAYQFIRVKWQDARKKTDDITFVIMHH